jgi:hypothetical protein
MPKTANAFHMNFASMTKSSSIVTLEIHIWENWPNLHTALSKLSMYNNYQSMVPFLSSDHRLLMSASTFANCCHFWTLQLRMRMLYLSHYDPFSYSHLIQDIQPMSYDPRLKKVAPKLSKTFDLHTFLMKTHLIHMTSSEGSLRVLVFTYSLAVDLVH